jgi:hypothetical protein
MSTMERRAWSLARAIAAASPFSGSATPPAPTMEETRSLPSQSKASRIASMAGSEPPRISAKRAPQQSGGRVEVDSVVLGLSAERVEGLLVTSQFLKSFHYHSLACFEERSQ